MTYQALLAEQVTDLCLQNTVRILDCRDIHSYEQGHLPGAERISDELMQRLLKSDRNMPVLVYCYHGVSSRELASLLVNFGFESVYNLEGGWQAWVTMKTRKNASLTDELQHWFEQQGFDVNNINSRIDNGMSALMQAALMAETGYVRDLLEAGIDVNLLNDDHNNALWFSCFSESLEIIELLISAGININNSNVNGATCLIYAASAGKYGVVKALVESGADLKYQTLDGFNALDSAATIDVLRYLKQCYATAS